MIVLVLAWMILDSVAVEENRQHLWGASTAVEARVLDATNEERPCSGRGGGRYDEYVFTVEWQEQGMLRTGEIHGCTESAYEVGEVVPVWIVGNKVHTESTSVAWVLTVLVLMLFAGLVAWMLMVLTRVRRRVAAVLSGARPAAALEAVILGGTPVSQFAMDTTRFRALVTVPDARGHLHQRKFFLGTLVHPLNTPPHQRVSGPVPGMLYPLEMRRGKPRGLMLHVSDTGVRTWTHNG